MSTPTTDVIRGSCLCGSITFEVTLPALWFHYCHCSSCRKTTSSAHASNLIFPPDAIRWLTGESQIQKFVDQTENLGFKREFCKTCGSAVPRLTRTNEYLVVPAGVLDDDPLTRPERSIYWSDRAPWYVETPEMPKFTEGMNSELME